MFYAQDGTPHTKNFKLRIYKSVCKLFILPDTGQTAVVSPQSITNYHQPEHVPFLMFFITITQ